MDVSEYTSIGRALDPRNRNHQILGAIAVLAGVAHGLFLLITTGDFWAAVLAGIAAGASVFIGWVLAREFDPAHPASALVAAGLAGALGFTMPDLLGFFALIPLIRVVNRIVGPPAKVTDTIGVLIPVTAAAFIAHPFYAFIAALAFTLDAVLVNPLRRQWIAAAWSVLVGVVALFANPLGLPTDLSGVWVFAAIAVIIAFAWYIMTTRETETKSDTGTALHLERVQAGMILAAVGGAALLVWQGNVAVGTLYPLWAAMASVVLWRLSGFTQSRS